MTRVSPVPQLIPEPRTKEELVEWIQNLLLKILRTELSQIRQTINNLHLENMNWRLLSAQTFTLADTEYSFTHDLGRIPSTVLPFITTDLGGVGANLHTTIYKGPTAWTASLVYLKSTRAAVNADLLII